MKVTSEKIIINGSDEDSLQKNKQYIGRILALEHRYLANNKDEFLREIEAVNNKIMASFRLEDKLLFERVLKGL